MKKGYVGDRRTDEQIAIEKLNNTIEIIKRQSGLTNKDIEELINKGTREPREPRKLRGNV